MPKLKEPKLTHRKDGRAVVHWNGKMYMMGKSGTPEAKIAFHRFCIEIQNQPAYIPPEVSNGKREVSIGELAAAFLDYTLVHKTKPNYTHYRILLKDFLIAIYRLISESRAGRNDFPAPISRRKGKNRWLASDIERYLASQSRTGLPDNFVSPAKQKKEYQRRQQAEVIKNAITSVGKKITETFGNENKNGNALYEVVRQWEEQKKLNSK